VTSIFVRVGVDSTGLVRSALARAVILRDFLVKVSCRCLLALQPSYEEIPTVFMGSKLKLIVFIKTILQVLCEEGYLANEARILSDDAR